MSNVPPRPQAAELERAIQLDPSLIPARLALLELCVAPPCSEGASRLPWSRPPRSETATPSTVVDLLREIAARKKATPAQIALAWLLEQKPWIGPISGTTKLHRLEENIGAAAVELTPDDLREIEDAAAKIAIQGARYPEALEKRTGL